MVAYHQGLYQDLYKLLESHCFSTKFHNELQMLWFKGHYKEAEKVRDRRLGKFIISSQILKNSFNFQMKIVQKSFVAFQLISIYKCFVLNQIRGCRQVPHPQKVSTADDNLGW